MFERVLHFQKVLQELMDERDLTQKNLATGLGVFQSQVSNWFTGKSLPCYDSLRKISNYFKVSADVLLDTKYDD
ncbi:MAG: helix-turn-helix domain-containing protein [Firmicutes bacterium]|nr:helix-turn-helix domain-containing protein [Bacillota bacterium]